ncbi:uncharacterized protein DEA37_0013896, partial [Paragonimus westermani]
MLQQHLKRKHEKKRSDWQNNGKQHEKVAEFSKVHLAEHNGLVDQFKQEVIECRAELEHVSDERDRLQFEVDVEKQKNSELLKNFVNSQSQLAVVNKMLDEKQEEVSFLKTSHHATEYEEIKQQLEEAIKLANTSSTEDSRLPLLMEALQADADDRQLLQTIHGELLTEQQQLRQTLLQTQSQLEELKVIREERNSNIKDLQRLNQSLVERVDSLGKTMNEKNKAVLLSYQLINEIQHNLATVNEQKNELSQHNAQLQNRIAELESEYEKRLDETRVPEKEASHPELSWNASLTNPAKSIQKLTCRLEIALKERAALLEYQLELEKTLRIQAEQISMFEPFEDGDVWSILEDIEYAVETFRVKAVRAKLAALRMPHKGWAKAVLDAARRGPAKPDPADCQEEMRRFKGARLEPGGDALVYA